MIPAFKSAAEELLNTSGLSAVELLAKALAKASVSSVYCSHSFNADFSFFTWISCFESETSVFRVILT